MITIAVLFQSLLGIYGDRGNGMVLTKRLNWRGIEANLVYVEPGDDVPADANIYLLGGGEDLSQITAVDLLQRSSALDSALSDGAVLFAVCAGYQICGHTFTVGHDDRVVPGLGLLDVETRRGKQRAVGEILTRWQRPDGADSLITGFENHGGFTRLGSQATPLAQVEKGIGNGYDGTEGALSPNGRVIGTYPHGPILARNPQLADHLLQLVVPEPLSPLPVNGITQLRNERIKTVHSE